MPFPWGSMVEASDLSAAGFPPSYHSAGLDDPTPSSGLQAVKEESLRAAEAAPEPGQWAAEAKIFLDSRVKWPVLNPCLMARKELDWTFVPTSCLPTACVVVGESSSPWPPTVSRLFLVLSSCTDGGSLVIWTKGIISDSSRLVERHLLDDDVPVESSARWRGSEAGLRAEVEVGVELEGEEVTEFLWVGMLMDGRAWGLLVESVTPSLAAIAQTLASRSRWRLLGSVLWGSGWTASCLLAMLRVGNVSAAVGTLVSLWTQTLEATLLLSVSVLPWLWKKGEKNKEVFKGLQKTRRTYKIFFPQQTWAIFGLK